MAFSSSSVNNGFFSSKDAEKFQCIREAKTKQKALYDDLEVAGQVLDTWERAVTKTDHYLDLIESFPINDHQKSVVQALYALQRHQLNMLVAAGNGVKKVCEKIDIVNKIVYAE